MKGRLTRRERKGQPKGKLVKTLAQLDGVLATVEAALLALTLGGAALITVALILGRNLINVSYNALEEVAVYLVLWMVFIGVVAAERTRSNISMDILYHVLEPQHTVRLQRFADGLLAGLCLALAFTALDAVSFSYTINEHSVSSLRVKIWPLMTVMPVAFFLVAVRATMRMFAPPVEEVKT